MLDYTTSNFLVTIYSPPKLLVIMFWIEFIQYVNKPLWFYFLLFFTPFFVHRLSETLLQIYILTVAKTHKYCYTNEFINYRHYCFAKKRT